MASQMALGLVLLLALCWGPTAVVGHAQMCRGMAPRNGLFDNGWFNCGYNRGPAQYCGFCLNAGGAANVYPANGQWTYPNGRNGICGDMPGEKQYEKGGPFATGFSSATYRPNQKVKVEVKIVAHHKGFFEWFLCPLTSNDSEATTACFKKYPIPLAKPFRGHRWWLPLGTEGGSRGLSYYVELLMPNVECKRCVVLWHYHTANSCTPPNAPKAILVKQFNSDVSKCGGKIGSGQVPEEFWNCADITLTRDPTVQTTPILPDRLTEPLGTDTNGLLLYLQGQSKGVSGGAGGSNTVGRGVTRGAQAPKSKKGKKKRGGKKPRPGMRA